MMNLVMEVPRWRCVWLLTAASSACRTAVSVSALFPTGRNHWAAVVAVSHSCTSVDMDFDVVLEVSGSTFPQKSKPSTFIFSKLLRSDGPVGQRIRAGEGGWLAFRTANMNMDKASGVQTTTCGFLGVLNEEAGSPATREGPTGNRRSASLLARGKATERTGLGSRRHWVTIALRCLRFVGNRRAGGRDLTVCKTTWLSLMGTLVQFTAHTNKLWMWKFVNRCLQAEDVCLRPYTIVILAAVD